MSKTKSIAIKRKKSLAKGVVAGLVAGLVGTAAKMVAERIFPPHVHDAEPLRPSHDSLALAIPEKSAKMHWALGGAAGAIYGGLAEFYPAATARKGASFGLVLATLTEEGALPAIGLAAESGSESESGGESMRDRTSELTSYAVYGVVTETVRRFIRCIL
jgi:putative membrane protein